MTRKMIVLVGALLMVASACAAGEETTQAGEPSVVAMPPTTVAPSVDSVADTGDATTEGIQVHGHWTIEVRNPGGSVASHVEFENSLASSGGISLGELLTGNRHLDSAAPDWLIVFDGSGFTQCGTTRDPGWRTTTGWCANVGLTLATVDQHQSTVTLAKSFTIDPSAISVEPASIASVGTVIGGGVRKVFTAKTLVVPVAIAANQTVYIEVEISFS